MPCLAQTAGGLRAGTAPHSTAHRSGPLPRPAAHAGLPGPLAGSGKAAACLPSPGGPGSNSPTLEKEGGHSAPQRPEPSCSKAAPAGAAPGAADPASRHGWWSAAAQVASAPRQSVTPAARTVTHVWVTTTLTDLKTLVPEFAFIYSQSTRNINFIQNICIS